MLVDPNLPTDLRMRLHNEIPEIVRAAHQARDADPIEVADALPHRATRP